MPLYLKSGLSTPILIVSCLKLTQHLLVCYVCLPVLATSVWHFYFQPIYIIKKIIGRVLYYYYYIINNIIVIVQDKTRSRNVCFWALPCWHGFQNQVYTHSYTTKNQSCFANPIIEVIHNKWERPTMYTPIIEVIITSDKLVDNVHPKNRHNENHIQVPTPRTQSLHGNNRGR
jgi:hypothetical protein